MHAQVGNLALTLAVITTPAQPVEEITEMPTPKVEAPTYQTFEATAYTAKCDGCIGITKTGVDVRNTVKHDGKRVIAVDPEVIPLGSDVEIRLPDGEVIKATAQDTGGAIKGNRVDVLKKTTEKALDFGRQEVKLRIIRKGGERD